MKVDFEMLYFYGAALAIAGVVALIYQDSHSPLSASLKWGAPPTLVKGREHMLTNENIKANLISAEKTPIGYQPTGSPFIIKLNIEDLDTLATNLSSGKPPFCILGIKSKVAEDEYVIYGTDLKNGCPIEMEVTPKWIAVHLQRIPQR